MKANLQAAQARILASEGSTIRFSPSELGGASFAGVTLGAYGEYCAAHGVTDPTLAQWEALGPAGKPLANDELLAFYTWDVFDRIEFDALPGGIDYALADGCVNDGDAGFLEIVRPLFRIPRPQAYWRMDDGLLAALNAAHPAYTICAICDARWAFMQVAKDFAQPSATSAGKIIGDGRALRCSSAFRGAMEMIGHAPVADRYEVFR